MAVEVMFVSNALYNECDVMYLYYHLGITTAKRRRLLFYCFTLFFVVVLDEDGMIHGILL
jgi:hypothetical protein